MKGWHRHSREHALAARGIPFRRTCVARGKNPIKENKNAIVKKLREIKGVRRVECDDCFGLKCIVFFDDGVSMELTFDVGEDRFFLDQMYASETGTGKGSMIVEALIDLEDKTGLEMLLFEVGNPDFWRKFDFSPEDSMDYTWSRRGSS